MIRLHAELTARFPGPATGAGAAGAGVVGAVGAAGAAGAAGAGGSLSAADGVDAGSYHGGFALPRVRLLLQIHDELIFEVAEASVDQARQIIREEMEGVFEKSFIHFESPVPISVNESIGASWQDL